MLLMQQRSQSSLLITRDRKPSAINRAISISHLGEPEARAQVEPVEASEQVDPVDSGELLIKERVKVVDSADVESFCSHPHRSRTKASRTDQ